MLCFETIFHAPRGKVLNHKFHNPITEVCCTSPGPHCGPEGRWKEEERKGEGERRQARARGRDDSLFAAGSRCISRSGSGGRSTLNFPQRWPDRRTGRSCRDGVLASNAEGSQKEDGCRKSRSQRGSNSITRTIQTPYKNPDWRRSPKIGTMHELGVDQAYHEE